MFIYDSRPEADREPQSSERTCDTLYLVFPVRFHAFLAGQDLDAFDPNQQHSGTDSQTPEQLAAAFARCWEIIREARPHIDIGGKMQIAILWDKIWRKLYSHYAE